MTLEEYIKEQRERVANMTLAQARQIVASHYGHDDMRIECEKAVKMLLDCAEEKINSGWIPIDKKRPSGFEKVLVTYRLHCDDSIHVGFGGIECNLFNGNYYWNINEPTNNWHVLAWMPLPKPYGLESEE